MRRPLIVPAALADRVRAHPEMQPWCAELPALAADLLRRWELVPDGDGWSGFLSAVWPVRDPDRRALVLKVGYPDPMTAAEAAALQRWDGRGTVRCRAHDRDANALLLDRLDGDRSLQDHPDVDEACRIIGEILAVLHPLAPPPGVRTVAAEAAGMAERLRRDAARHPLLLPERAVARALETLAELATDPDPGWLLHADCHFLNVLPTLDGDGWLAIDPLPALGPREWELLPVLRNRWEDAVATGDPERALGRRVDQLCELTGADRDRARAVAQAAATFAVLAMTPTDPHHFFLPPYRLMTWWEGSAA